MKLMILDGNSVINRAFYGVRPLTTREGFYTNAIFGFLNILQREVKNEAPDALCVAFDLHGPTFRHVRYDGYKATRHGMPEELAMQMPVMKQVLAAMHIPIYECQGWEADDVIGTVARICCGQNWKCVVLTGDRDSLQLVNDCVTVRLVRTQGGQTLAQNYTPEVFFEEYGMEPIRLIDLKALMGDSSDNIPGVAGVGPKTARDLLQKYGTLDGVYENLTPQNMKGKLFEKLQNGKETAYLSYELATIRCDAPIEFSPEENLIRQPNRRALYDLFTKLEFQKLIDKYNLRSAAFEEDEAAETPAAVVGECRSELVETEARARELAALFAEQGHVVLHFLEGFSAFAVYAPQTGNVMYLYTQEQLGAAYESVLRELLTANVRKVVHDSKPLMRALLAKGLPVDGFVFDTAVAAYLLDATRGKYALSSLTEDYLHFTPPQDTTPYGILMSEAASVEALYETLS